MSTTSSEVFRFPAELMHRQAMQVLARLQQGDAQSCAVIDLSDLRSFDSSVLAVLLAARRRPQACRFSHVPDNLAKLASLYGLDGLLFDTVARA
jgi:ABC-type transporter Mla MlaB component